MSQDQALSTMTDVRDLLAEADPEERLVPCEIGDIRLSPGAVASLPDVVADLLAARGADPAGAHVLLLVDRTPIRRGDEDLKDLVEARLGERFSVSREVLSDGHSELHVSEDVVATATAAVAGASAVVAVGGGTICDIAKLAAAQAPEAVLVVVQTAASVDGFTDNVSVLLRGGVKRTVPSRWPDLVLADVETIAGAPAGMNRAGFGEMTSMFTARADWRLAAVLGFDESFHPGPIALLEAVGSDIADWSPGLRGAEPAAVERLTWALALRGIATGVAGTTACLSGVEHLVSHMLDLHHGAHHLPMGLHGAQVGVASVVAASAWELLFERLAAGSARIDPAALDEGQARTRIGAAFAHLDSSGQIAAECWSDYGRKLAACARQREHIDDVLSHWADHRPEVARLVRPAAEIGGGIRAAGGAARFSELEPKVTDDLALWAVQNCALMRNRFTVVDLLTLLGWWNADDVAEVLQRAGDATAASTTKAVSSGG